jgi:hypothetical protein
MANQRLDYVTPDETQSAQVRVLRLVRRAFGFIALAALIFAGLNAGDLDPLQWPAMFVFMACLAVYVVAAGVCGVVGWFLAKRTNAKQTDHVANP